MIDRRRPVDRRLKNDRRFHQRNPSDTRIRFLLAGTSPQAILQGELVDVSLGGLGVRLTDRVEVADRLLIEVREKDDCCFSLSATVVWIEWQPDLTLKLGCELAVDLTRRQHTVLKRLRSLNI